MTMMTEDYVTIREAAEMLDVTTATIYNYFKRDVLTRYRVGGGRKVLISVEEIRRLQQIKPAK